MRHTHLFLPLLLLAACGGGGGSTPPPSSTTVGTPPTSVVATPPVAPPGQVMITVAAASTPPGATVTGGGQVLGVTPFTSQVPVPAPQPGETQAFQFTFTLPGFQPATVTASPVNNTISLSQVLVSAMAPPTTTGFVPGTPPATTGGSMRVRGIGGGPVYDYHTTTSTATVSSPCVIRQLRVDIGGSHTFNRDLEVSLRAPDGTSFSLQRHSSRSPFRVHTVSRARGHLAMGVWTLAVEDTVGADRGVLSSFEMLLDCM
ncbi:MAG: proprotein convertase P-domain-containing protein [Sandaracinus sp.]